MDAEGRRVQRTYDSVTTDYFYLGATVIAEKTGSAWTDYIFFGGQRIAQNTGSSLSTTKFLHPDHLGSTRVCTDGSGGSAGTCYYEPFGEFQAGTTCSVPTSFRFAGMQWDEDTGLYHTWFREYDATQGRWTGVDPLSGDVSDPQTFNRYVYARNDPVNLVDPLGLSYCFGYHIWMQTFDRDTGELLHEEYFGFVAIWCTSEEPAGGITDELKAQAEEALEVAACLTGGPLFGHLYTEGGSGTVGYGLGLAAGYGGSDRTGSGFSVSMTFEADKWFNVGVYLNVGAGPAAGKGVSVAGGGVGTASNANTITATEGWNSSAGGSAAGKGYGGAVEIGVSDDKSVKSVTAMGPWAAGLSFGGQGSYKLPLLKVDCKYVAAKYLLKTLLQ